MSSTTVLRAGFSCRLGKTLSQKRPTRAKANLSGLPVRKVSLLPERRASASEPARMASWQEVDGGGGPKPGSSWDPSWEVGRAPQMENWWDLLLADLVGPELDIWGSSRETDDVPSRETYGA